MYAFMLIQYLTCTICLATRQPTTPKKYYWTAPSPSKKRKRDPAPEEEESDTMLSSQTVFWIPKFQLTMNHKRRLLDNRRLDDSHINAFQRLIAQAFASQGWQNVAVGHAGFDFSPAPSVQILHNGNNHWLASASTSDGICVADSLLNEPNLITCQQLLDLYCKEGQDWLDVTYLDVQLQSGGTQCGDFAIAFAAAFASGKTAQTVRALRFDQARMRSHLMTCLTTDQFSPFPMPNASSDFFCATHYRPVLYRIAKADASHIRQADRAQDF